jgi:hypothetical protein
MVFFQIDPDLALVALQVKMEQVELQACEEEILSTIDRASRESLLHIEKILAPLKLSLGSDHSIIRRLTENKNILTERYRRLRQERNDLFPFQIERVPHSDRIALEQHDLEITLQKAAFVVEHFYSTRILTRKTEAEREKFWESNRLLENDWKGLARSLLSTVFSARFLKPLEEVDKQMSLKVDHVNIHQYAEGLMHTGAIPDDLSVTSIDCPNYYKEDIPATVPFLATSSLAKAHPFSPGNVYKKFTPKDKPKMFVG